MKTLFPQKINNKWVLLTWNKNLLIAHQYKTFLGAVLEYNKNVK